MLRSIAIYWYSRLSAAIFAMNPTCIFCKIASGESKATILHHDDLVTAFRDIHPLAPTHVLIVPNEHITSVNGVTPGHEALLGHLFVVARQIAEEENIAEGGYRLIVNTGAHGGQSVFHMHMHLLGGGRMKYPMG